MQTILLLSALVSVTLVLYSRSAGREEQAPPAAPPPPKELEALKAWVGEWDAEVEMMGAVSKGKETCRIECGGNWLVTEHTGTFQGAPFQGKGLTGWDPAKQAYVGVWVDSTGGPMSYFQDGQLSKDGRTFSSHVEGAGMDGAPARFEYRTTFSGATRVFEIFVVGAGNEPMMRVKYTRKK
jgi:hypothetical protein